MINKKFKDQFERDILTRPIIFDYDLDALLCLAYINTILKKRVVLAGLKSRERDQIKIRFYNISNTALMIKSIYPWKDCSFIDFEVHGCPSIGQHLLLKWDENIISPNREGNIEGSSNLYQKYPMNTILYLLYLYEDLDKYTEEQLKLISIPDKTFQNSWKYNKNFLWWEKKLKFPIELHKILNDKNYKIFYLPIYVVTNLYFFTPHTGFFRAISIQ